MTRAAAMVKFASGRKIKHESFSLGQYVVLNSENQMIDETGKILVKMDFWMKRCQGLLEGWVTK